MLQFIISATKKAFSSAKSIRGNRGHRSMRLCETLSLGDRRSLALIVVGQEKFLVATAGNSISLLARFPSLQEAKDPLAGAESHAMFDAEESKTWR
jgi:flagellar biogenesis protein FliO